MIIMHTSQCPPEYIYTLHTFHTPSQVTSTLKEKLISPVSAASTVTTPINIQAVTRGQSTRSQATHAVKVEMTTKTAPRGDNKQGGRHPHPPTGNNKKLKHMVRTETMIIME